MSYYPIDYQFYTNMVLYTDAHPETTIKVGFKNKQAALDSIKKIAHKQMDYQIKVIITLYYRAKFHPHQTANMKKAMGVFAKWLNKYSPTTLSK